MKKAENECEEVRFGGAVVVSHLRDADANDVTALALSIMIISNLRIVKVRNSPLIRHRSRLVVCAATNQQWI
jgi:hypothetical protein